MKEQDWESTVEASLSDEERVETEENEEKPEQEQQTKSTTSLAVKEEDALKDETQPSTKRAITLTASSNSEANSAEAEKLDDDFDKSMDSMESGKLATPSTTKQACLAALSTFRASMKHIESRYDGNVFHADVGDDDDDDDPRKSYKYYSDAITSDEDLRGDDEHHHRPSGHGSNPRFDRHQSFGWSLRAVVDHKWAPWHDWDAERRKWTAFGCISSSVVLAIRLWLDMTPTAYLVHSIVVFFDMVLIHLFTKSVWLSVSGEIVTVMSFLAFHFTKKTVFEFLETTLIAVLCSFHLIQNRNQQMFKNEELVEDMQSLQRTSLFLLRHVNDIDPDELEHEISEIQTKKPAKFWDITTLNDGEACKKKFRACGSHFYDHFLDGSAGVMYTSFLGLILSELIDYVQGGSKY